MPAVNKQAQFTQATAPSLWIAAGLAMGTVVAVGLARYAYALLLPAMCHSPAAPPKVAAAAGDALLALGDLQPVRMIYAAGTGAGSSTYNSTSISGFRSASSCALRIPW